jgi:hypothetical protein
MGTVLHLLCEDIGGVDFPSYMDNIQSLVLDSFPNRILTELGLTSRL